MPQQKHKPSTAAQRANEALDRAAPEGKTPARRTLAFLLEGSHDEPQVEIEQIPPEALPDAVKSEVTLPEAGSGGVTPPDPTQPIAPTRNFNKRANSLDRLALPAGIFPGSSKRLYDALYVRTRGAVVPCRNLRATKRELSEWSGIRNIKTIDAHLRYFSAVGLIISTWERGQNDGALYEVLLPEETSGLFVRAQETALPYPTSPHVTPREGESPQILGSPPYQNLGSPHATQVVVNSTTYSDRKTFFKTNTENDDDEAVATAIWRELKKVIFEITGREATPLECSKMIEVIEVIALEGKIAAARTTVSSAAPFLAEHLRRRLFKKNKQEMALEASSAPNEQLSTSIDISQCPDCHGTSMYYPDGYEKGVARCMHKRLLESQIETSSNGKADTPV